MTGKAVSLERALPVAKQCEMTAAAWEHFQLARPMRPNGVCAYETDSSICCGTAVELDCLPVHSRWSAGFDCRTASSDSCFVAEL